MNGYQTQQYAHALGEIGNAVHLPRCDGWLLERPIPGSEAVDAAGGYPFFSCRNWSELGADIEALGGRFVAVSMVVDPFSGLDGRSLARWFPDVCYPYKEHAVVDLRGDWRQTVSLHHRRNVRAASRSVAVERCDVPYAWFETWCELYSHLIARHGINGMARFSRSSFERQFRVPGLTAFRGIVREETVAMHLWYLGGDVAYYHLGASSPRGYERKAAFALFDAALGHFANCGIQWTALGAGAGWCAAEDDGLSRFKRGWANDARTAWFCGRILNPDRYRRLTRHLPEQTRSFFPVYRHPDRAIEVSLVGA
jgi:Acetyltransferase (GNAT) domain